MKHFKHLLFNTKMKSIQKLWQHNKTRVMGMEKKRSKKRIGSDKKFISHRSHSYRYFIQDLSK